MAIAPVVRLDDRWARTIPTSTKTPPAIWISVMVSANNSQARNAAATGWISTTRDVRLAGTRPRAQVTPPCPATCISPMAAQASHPPVLPGRSCSPSIRLTANRAGVARVVVHTMTRMAEARRRATDTARK